MTLPFIAVHAGAGNHADNTVKDLKKLCKEACTQAIQQLIKGSDSVTAVTTAITILEDSPLTNAGYGSCLTLQGSVECDASIMTGDGTCGIIGAVNGIKNPVKLAHRLLTEQSKGLLSLGRIPPLCLCGDGARLWARTNGIQLCEPEKLISDCSKELYIDHMSRLNNESLSIGPPLSKKPCNKQNLDTIGAVCIDSNGIISACCSSGGISLKHSGRVGQAGMYGCGCWAQGNPDCDRIATSVSGVGETLIKTCLARDVSLSMLSKNDLSLKEIFHNVYIDSVVLDDSYPKLAGLIVLNVSPSGLAEFSWAHSTDNMLICHMTAADSTPKIVFSEICNSNLGSDKTKCDRLCVGGISVRLK